MKYSLADFPALVQTPLGRSQFTAGLRFQLSPLYIAAARIHLKTTLRRTRKVVVVGSYGKTTTTRATVAAFGGTPEPGRGSNARAGLARMILKARPGDGHAVLEVGISRPGAMAGYARMIRPDVTVVMSVGSEHQRSLKSLENTRDEKAEMVRILEPDGLALLNGDDPNVLWMRSQTRARVLCFGREPHNDVQIHGVRLDWPHGTSFRARLGDEDCELHVRLVGAPMVHALTAAVAVAWAEGVALGDVAERLSALPPTVGRLEPLALANGVTLLKDAYKSSLETVDAALDVLEEIPARRKLVVMGEISEPPGSQGPIYRRIGERVAKIASHAVFVGANFQRYAAGARRGGMPDEAVVDAGRSPVRAVEEIRRVWEPGDVVLIKGRDTQRLERIGLALAGRELRCDLPTCNATIRGPGVRCDGCSMFERGWEGRRVVF